MITAVYINNNAGVKPVKAELLGQDALNLVTDVKSILLETVQYV